MIRKLFALVLIAGFFASCAGNAEKKEGDSSKDEAQVQTEIPVIAIGDFNSTAGKYVGQEIQISGIVDHICRHGGKRLLLVDDEGDVHIDGEERFDEGLEGSEIVVIGLVDEFRVDEAYCLKLEEEAIKAHNAGETDPADFESANEEIKYYRDSMMAAGTDHISYYSVTYVSHQVKE